MEVINKTIQPTVEEALLSLALKTQCLVFLEVKKAYVRNQIRKIKLFDDTIKYKTKIEDGKIFVWRLS